LQIEVNVLADRRLSIELPEDIEAGSYQIVLVMNPVETKPHSSVSGQMLNKLAGKVTSFAGVDAVTWQQQQRDEWNVD
jgi:hypothetical protein